MKKNCLFLILLFSLCTLTNSITAQNSSDAPPEIIRDRLMVDVFHSFWLGVPSEVNANKFHPGFNISMMWDFKQKKQVPVSFGLGLGVTYYSQFSDGLLTYDNDRIMRYFVVSRDSFKLNRMNYVSCNIPLEFRYRHRNGIKFTIGVRVGIMAELSQTYKGNDPEENGNKLHRKSYEIYNKQKFNFDVYARFGWKYISIYYSYQITPLFTKGKGPNLTPMSLGITWNLF